MADKPRRTGTIRPVRTRRGIRQKAGVPEKPESASKRLRTRANVAETADPQSPGSTTSGDVGRMADDPERPQGAETTMPSPAPADEANPARGQTPRSRGRSAGRKAQAATAAEAAEGKAGSEPPAPPLRAEAKRKTGRATARTSGKSEDAVAPSGEAPGARPQKSSGGDQRSARRTTNKTAELRVAARAPVVRKPQSPTEPTDTIVAGLKAAEPTARVRAEVATQGLGIATALGEELADFSKRLVEESTARAQELTAARTLAELVEIQGRQLRAVSDAWLRHTTRMSDIFLSAFREQSRR